MLTGKNIYKRYGTLEVLRGVNLEIQKGEVVTIVGPSGCGKSTLLHILGSLDKADSGEITISGNKIENSLSGGIPVVAWPKRLINYLLDSIVISLLTLGIISLLAPLALYKDSIFIWIISLSTLIVLITYYTLFEGLIGKTVGKYFTQTKVIVSDDQSKPSLKEGLIRALCRLIPFEALSFLSKNPKGLHDTFSGTMVVDKKAFYQTKSKGILTGKRIAAFRNRHIGFVFQFHHLLPEFTALENVCIPGWLAGRNKNEVRTKAEELLKILGLENRIDNMPNQMSGGEQQRVAVARALINNPDIVFADEPTGNLDSANAQELHQLFFDLRKQFNQTFLIVTHNEELSQLSDRTLHMKDGKIV